MKTKEMIEYLQGFDEDSEAIEIAASPKMRKRYVGWLGAITDAGKPVIVFTVEEEKEFTEEEIAAEEQENGKKPPLGLMPRKLWDEKRANEIKAAINRYTKAGLEIPTAWVEEYFEIEERSKEE